MIKCKITRKGNSRFRAKGNAGDLATETAVLINQVYTGIKEDCPELAEAYRKKLLAILIDLNGPVWKEIDHG